MKVKQKRIQSKTDKNTEKIQLHAMKKCGKEKMQK